MPVGRAKFDVNRCNESPLRGGKPNFWPVSKFNTGKDAAKRHPAVNQYNRSVLIKRLVEYIAFLVQSYPLIGVSTT